jgi:hypothetical protein
MDSRSWARFSLSQLLLMLPRSGSPPASPLRRATAPARRLLHDLARRLETDHPRAAESVREGLDETLTVLTLGISDRLRRSLATTNAAESLVSRTRHVGRNVKRWRSGRMILRWVGAGVLEAVKGFRRLKGYADMPQLVAVSEPATINSGSSRRQRRNASRSCQ